MTETKEAIHTLQLQREFNVSPRTMFAAIQKGLLFVSCGFDDETKQLDFRVGGNYKYQYQKEEGVSGEFLEIVPDKKVVFTWGEANTKVTLRIEATQEGCKLHLTHELIPDAYWHDRFKGGWTYGLDHFPKILNAK